jgi:type IV secretory pathway VirB9-like protein
MRPLFPLLLVGTLLSTRAFALDPCKPSPDDKQARICIYSPTQRYIVNGLVGYPVDLRFGDAERIKRIELAYTGLAKDGAPAPTWRGPDVKGAGANAGGLPGGKFQNNLPIWPFQDGRSALLVVTATPDGNERPYLFDLTARNAASDCGATTDGPGCPDDDKTTSTLAFVYPADAAAAAREAAADRKKAAVAAWQAREDKVKEDEAVARLRTDVFYGPRNFAYQAKADPKFKTLAPSEVSDNGWLTEMQWPANVQMPTITILDPASGEERVAPVSQQGQMQIISTTAEWFRLRLGPKAVMDIHNLAWKAERADPHTGTTSPDVVRQVIYQDVK